MSMELILNKRKLCVYFKCDMFLIPCASFTSHLEFGNCCFKPCLCVNLCIIYWPTYLLTYSRLQSPSWEANWFAASQEIPRISRKPKVHYRTHKRPPPVPILGQPNPVHIPTFHLLEIYSNIIHPSKPRSPQWSPSLRFPQKDPIHPIHPPPHMPSPSHSSWFYHPHNIGWGVQII